MMTNTFNAKEFLRKLYDLAGKAQGVKIQVKRIQEKEETKEEKTA